MARRLDFGEAGASLAAVDPFSATSRAVSVPIEAATAPAAPAKVRLGPGAGAIGPEDTHISPPHLAEIATSPTSKPLSLRLARHAVS